MKRALLCLALAIAPALAGPLDPPTGSVATTGPTQIFSVPYTISAAGSYRLSRNLVIVPTGNLGITISASNVTLDLSGFTLDGVNVLFGGTAITIAPSVTNVTIRNGTVQQWRNIITGSAQVHLQDLKFINCGEINVQPYYAITAGPNSTMDGCTFKGFGNNLALFGDGAVVQRCTGDNGAESAAMNIGNRSLIADCVFTQAHITGGESCTVSRCTVRPDWGPTTPNPCITVGAGCIVQECNVSGSNNNLVTGIAAGANSSILSCTVTGGPPGSYQAVGITAGAGSTVRGCKVAVTGEFATGIAAPPFGVVSSCSVTSTVTAISQAGAGSTIEGNTVYGSATGISVTGVQNLVVRNTARGNTTDYALGAGNSFGPIVNATAGGDLALIPGASHPQANFRY